MTSIRASRKKAVTATIITATTAAIVGLGFLVYHFKSVLFVALMLFALATATLGFNLRQDFRTSYDYEDFAEIGDIQIRAALQQSHPFLAEYKRYVWIGDGRRMFIGDDPGGHPEINVFNLDNYLILQTFSPKILIIDKQTKRPHFESRMLADEEISAFAGKFHFVPMGRYKFITKEEDPAFSSEMLKGG